LGVRFGKTLIVDDLYNVEPAMVQLLRKEFSTQGPRQVCIIGDKQIDVNEQFRLFLCTRNEQIRLQGHIRAAVTEVNFSTTLAGLSSQVIIFNNNNSIFIFQILSLALNIERPELQDQSVKLASEAEQLNLQLAEIEQVLLNVRLFHI
jgi:dynein heavy chain 2